MDGEAARDARPIETKPSGLVYFDPYSEEELRLYLPEGDHVFRAGFIDDEFVKTLPTDGLRTTAGRTSSSTRSSSSGRSRRRRRRRAGRRFSPAIRRSGRRVRRANRHRPGAPRLPASGDAHARSTSLAAVRRSGEGRRPVRRAGHPARDPGDAGVAELSLPHRARSRPARSARSCTRCRRSSWPRASATSCGARCRMTSCSTLAESGRLRDPAVLDGAGRIECSPTRAPRRSPTNFAGQWLETRNLDVVKPDPDKFKEWDPELRDAMKTETAMFFEHVLRENRPVSDFLNADYTFLNERLAAHYGIDGVTGPEFRRVQLTDRSARRRAEPGARADGLELSDAHLARHSRQVRAAEHPRHASRRRRRPTSRCSRGRRRRVEVRARAARAAPQPIRSLRSLSPQHGSAGLRPRELRRHRPLAGHGRQVPRGCRAARCPDGQRFTTAGGDAGASRVAIAAVLTYPDREDDDLRAAAGG